MSQVNKFLEHARVEKPIICGAMYPCSNPELIAAVSEAGGLGIVQPISLTFVHGYEIRAGIKKIKSLTAKPIGFNIITEKSAQIYQKRMEEYLDVALDEGIRFFITALGDPEWVIKRVSPLGGIVYHDVTEKKYALKVIDKGISGFICVNNRAGGHAGTRSANELLEDLRELDRPMICAGGIGSREEFQSALAMGYDGVQMGTRFIATVECSAHEDYKQAILKSKAEDIVLTDRVTGVPLAVINTPYLRKIGPRVGPITKFFLNHRRTKHLLRMWFSVISFFKLKTSNFRPLSPKDFWQAGKSVENISSILKAGDVIRDFTS